MSQIENYREHSGPVMPKVITFLLLVLGLAGSVYFISTNELFTAGYTNGFSIYFTVLCHLGLVVSNFVIHTF